uniref:C2H2-type domain-containing protein n=1 Tax=Graphocephala atropunctata TaxID=36148 RepID=A0A1B6KBT8_9HEMI
MEGETTEQDPLCDPLAPDLKLEQVEEDIKPDGNQDSLNGSGDVNWAYSIAPSNGKPFEKLASHIPDASTGPRLPKITISPSPSPSSSDLSDMNKISLLSVITPSGPKLIYDTRFPKETPKKKPLLLDCFGCGRKYRRRPYLRAHQRKCEILKDALISCDKCSMMLTSRANFYEHVRSVHHEGGNM